MASSAEVNEVPGGAGGDIRRPPSPTAATVRSHVRHYRLGTTFPGDNRAPLRRKFKIFLRAGQRARRYSSSTQPLVKELLERSSSGRDFSSSPNRRHWPTT